MNLSRHFYAVGGILTILTAASFGSMHYKTVAAAAPITSVLVTNSSSQPVPTTAQGTTQVAGTVGLSNGASVAVNNALTLAGNTSVAVNNPVALASGTKVGINGTVSLDPNTTVNLPFNASNPLAVKADTGVPFNEEIEFTIPAGDSAISGEQLYIVPPGKQLVITELYGYEDSPSGVVIQKARLLTFNGAPTEIDYPLPFTNSTSAEGFESSNCLAMTNIVVPPSSFVIAYVNRSSAVGQTLVDVGFAGYLQDAVQS